MLVVFSAFWVSDRGLISCILIPLGSAVRVSCLLGAFWGPAVGAFLLAAAGFLPVAVRGFCFGWLSSVLLHSSPEV